MIVSNLDFLQLKDFYNDELIALRDDAKEFGGSNKEVAHELGLSGGKSDDPHVELLLQSFAYLSGRLRYQLEADSNVIPNGLLERLYPHLVASVPSMSIMQLDVDPAGANFVNAPVLKSKRQFEKLARNDEGENVRCHFRTAYDTNVWPLEVKSVSVSPTNQYDFIAKIIESGESHSVLKVKVSATGEDPINTLPVDKLRFYLDSETDAGYGIYELLASQLEGISIVSKEKTESGEKKHVHHIKHETDFRWCGYDDNEAILPDNISTHPGYRLVQEYFAFPGKFLFFEVSGLNLEHAEKEFEILFILKSTPAVGLKINKNSMRLNCVPVVNLFEQALEPTRLDQRRYEYKLSADWAQHRYNEVYQINDLYAMRKDGGVRNLAPFYAVDLPTQESDYFFSTRREESQPANIAGTEMYVSFLDLLLNTLQPADEMISGKALCTNRQLPERLHSGDIFNLEGNGPIKTAHLITKPSRHITPRLIGTQPWSMISQLSLNYLSLCEGEESLKTLKNMLRLHVGSNSDISQKQIESLSRIKSQMTVRNVTHDSWQGFCRGVAITMRLDKRGFHGHSGLLFADVVRRFLALFANVNSFIQLSLYSEQNQKEIWKKWKPLAGNQTLL